MSKSSRDLSFEATKMVLENKKQAIMRGLIKF